MSWSLSAKADVREIGGVLRTELDRSVHRQENPTDEANYGAISAAIASATQLATSGWFGTNGVGVVISGQSDLAGREGTVSIVVGTVEIDPIDIGPVAGRPESRFRHTLEETIVDDTTRTDDTRPEIPTNPFGSGREVTEPIGQTDSAAFLAAQAEVLGVERDRNDDEQIRARRDEQLKLERQARERGSIDGADIVLGPERRPNDPVTQAQEERDRAMLTDDQRAGLTADRDANTSNPNETFLEHLDSANPDATGELVPTADGGLERITGEDLLAQPPDGLDDTAADPTFIQPAEVTDPADVVTEETGVPRETELPDNGDDVDDEGEIKKDRLQELAREHELPVSGTKAEIRQRLDDAGVEVTEA